MSYCSAKADNFTTKCAQLIGKCFRDLETVSLGGLIVDVTALVFIGKHFWREYLSKLFQLVHSSDLPITTLLVKQVKTCSVFFSLPREIYNSSQMSPTERSIWNWKSTPYLIDSFSKTMSEIESFGIASHEVYQMWSHWRDVPKRSQVFEKYSVSRNSSCPRSSDSITW